LNQQSEKRDSGVDTIIARRTRPFSKDARPGWLWRESLRRGSEHFPELATEMRGIGKLKVGGNCFGRISSREKFFGRPALERSQPKPRSSVEILLKEPFQLPQSNKTVASQLVGRKVSRLGQLFPILNSCETPAHLFLPQITVGSRRNNPNVQRKSESFRIENCI
jgi:hypothetical protein